MTEAMAVKQDIPTKTIKYKKDRSDETAELERLEKERAGILQQQKAESEDKAETETLDAEEKTFKKRYGDLRRFAQKKEEEYTAKIRDLEDKISAKAREAIKLPKSDEELAAWSKEYPEVAKVIETIASKKAKEFDASLEKRLQSIAEKEAEASRKTAEAVLLQIHPDFEEIRADQNFHDWVTEQPKWVQQALYENDTDGKAAARAIDLYKVDMNIATKKKSTDKNAAASVTTRGQSANVANSKSDQTNQWKESQVAKMRPQEYSKNEESIMAAIQSGNFIYDVTRGGN
tara:strand:- start:1226 stop:2092 length:867 start_codon:yes stop_codon:yes gene_type:complete